MNTNRQAIAKESWSGFVMFIIGYFASIFSTLSNDLRENYLPLAIAMMVGFSVLAGTGILLQAKSNVASNEKISDLEKKVEDLEKEINKIKTA